MSYLIVYGSVVAYALFGLLVGTAYGRWKQVQSISDYWIGWGLFWPVILVFLAWVEIRENR